MQEELAKIHVGKLHENVTDPDLYDSFEKFGAITYVSIVTDRETGDSRGFGFVQFESESSAEDAISAASSKSGVTVKGRECTVELCRPKRRGGFRGGFRGRGFDTGRGRGRYQDQRGGYSSGERYGGGGRGRYDNREDRYGGGARYNDGDRYGGTQRYAGGGRGGYGGGRDTGSYIGGRGYDDRYNTRYSDQGGYGKSGGGGYGRRDNGPSGVRYDGFRPRGSSRY